MKTLNFKMLAMIIALTAIVFTSCTKDEDKGVAPTIQSVTLTGDNAKANVVFSAPVYKNDNATGALDNTSLKVAVSGGKATLKSYTVTHTAGSTEATIDLVYDGVADGTEVVSVKPASASAIYGALGANMDAAQEKTATMAELGIIGNWLSEGTNVAPLLVSFGIAKIEAKFNADKTYEVISYPASGAASTLKGTYVQKKNANGIWDITVTQTSPTGLTSVGIFQITSGSPVTMKYEVAQTSPAITGVTPPTAAAGFGSTSGGALGTINIQTYVKK